MSAAMSGLDSPDIVQLDDRLRQQMETSSRSTTARQKDKRLVRPSRFGLPDKAQPSRGEPSIFSWFNDYLDEVVGQRIAWNGFLAWRWGQVARRREEVKRKQQRLESWKRLLATRSEAVRNNERYIRITEHMEMEARQLREQKASDQLSLKTLMGDG
jgi:hypothetical protein